MNDFIKAKELLSTGNYTCVLCKEEQIYTSTLRGVKPLVTWYEQHYNFTDYSAADKVIGKATAFLYVLLGVKNVYANVISHSALHVLKSNHITVEYKTLVENIINRQGNGICPFESAVMNITKEQEAYKAIRQKMEEMNITI